MKYHEIFRFSPGYVHFTKKGEIFFKKGAVAISKIIGENAKRKNRPDLRI